MNTTAGEEAIIDKAWKRLPAKDRLRVAVTIAKSKGEVLRAPEEERPRGTETARQRDSNEYDSESRTNARQDRAVFKVVAAAVLTRLGPRAREGGAD